MRLNETSAAYAAVVMIIVSVVARQWSQRSAKATRGTRSTKGTRAAKGTKAAGWISSATFEISLVCALFSLWQLANQLTRGHTTGGLKRGRQLYHFERVIHLPTEKSVQDLIIGHPDVVKVANYYYDTAHLTVMFFFLIWLWLAHRDHYPRWRNTLAVFTLMSLLIQMVSVAPPRLIGGTGLVDTAAYYHQSVYAAFGDLTDQYAAMPSIHVGWAMLVSFAVVSSSTSRWRWIMALYGPLTFFVVVATANHYWMDGFVACALLAIAWYAAKGLLALKTRLVGSVSLGEPALEPAQIQQGAFSR